MIFYRRRSLPPRVRCGGIGVARHRKPEKIYRVADVTSARHLEHQLWVR